MSYHKRLMKVSEIFEKQYKVSNPSADLDTKTRSEALLKCHIKKSNLSS